MDNKELKEDLRIEKIKVKALTTALEEEKEKVRKLEEEKIMLQMSAPNPNNYMNITLDMFQMKEKLEPYIYKKLQEKIRETVGEVADNMIMDSNLHTLTFPDVEDINRKIEKLEDWKNDIEMGYDKPFIKNIMQKIG